MITITNQRNRIEPHNVLQDARVSITNAASKNGNRTVILGKECTLLVLYNIIRPTCRAMARTTNFRVIRLRTVSMRIIMLKIMTTRLRTRKTR